MECKTRRAGNGMLLNREKMTGLLQKYCNGNYNRFARELGVDPSHIYRFLKSGVGGGSKLVGAVMKFCKGKHIEFEEYIDL